MPLLLSLGCLLPMIRPFFLEQIDHLKETCDYVVVYVHWGLRKRTGRRSTSALGKQYIDAGADLVIGSHPHVLQGIEYYKGKPIVYSLGNFIFGSCIPKQPCLQQSGTGKPPGFP